MWSGTIIVFHKSCLLCDQPKVILTQFIIYLLYIVSSYLSWLTWKVLRCQMIYFIDHQKASHVILQTAVYCMGRLHNSTNADIFTNVLMATDARIKLQITKSKIIAIPYSYYMYTVILDKFNNYLLHKSLFWN